MWWPSGQRVEVWTIDSLELGISRLCWSDSIENGEEPCLFLMKLSFRFCGCRAVLAVFASHAPSNVFLAQPDGDLVSGARGGLPAGVKRVVVLGDSITYSGQYIEYVEAYAVSRFPERRIEFLNLGLPSETVSGLTEPGHAGGQFPRPDLHERLARVLAQTKPDFIIACYGMNDGIYYPFGEERFFRNSGWHPAFARTGGLAEESPAYHAADVRPDAAARKNAARRSR
jgi:hypothetical protein